MVYEWQTNRGYKPLAQWVNAGQGWVPNQGSTQAIIGGFDVSTFLRTYFFKFLIKILYLDQ